MNKYIPLLFIACFWLTTLSAQKRIRSGVMTYELQKIEGKIEGLNMMEGSTMTMTFASKMQKLDIDIMYGVLRFQQIQNSEKETFISLYDWLGEQLKVEDSLVQVPTDTLNNNLVINYLRDSIRIIEGYECFQAIAQNETEKITFWLTDKIKVNNSWFQQKYPTLEGFPLAYKCEQKDVQFLMNIKSIESKIDPMTFDIPNEYKAISPEEFEEKMGGWSLDF